jgi:hypothetical protein
MKKRIVRAVVISAVILVALYLAAWIAASNGLFGDAEFGYYGEFNVAKHAIQESGCAEAIEYSGVNKDVFLEEFHFKVTTKSGRVIRLWFDADNMDVSQVCHKPVGFSVWHPMRQLSQRYSAAGLLELLRVKNIQVDNLRDILCYIDELEEVFRENNGDPKVRERAMNTFGITCEWSSQQKKGCRLGSTRT